MKIKAIEVRFIWDDDSDNEVARFLPEGTMQEIENFADYWEQEYGNVEE
jgi:hypothetical protein